MSRRRIYIESVRFFPTFHTVFMNLRNFNELSIESDLSNNAFKICAPSGRVGEPWVLRSKQ